MSIILKRNEGPLVFELPEEAGRDLGWGPGDELESAIVESGVTITRSKTEHDQTMEIAEKVMDEYRDVFIALAKS